jgi:threonine dehydratase
MTELLAQLRSEINSCQARFHAGHASFLRETPLLKLPGAALGIDCAQVWLKLEHLQMAGSFKARGMLNRLLAHPIGPAGVVVASGGNAGIATAAAAKYLGVACEVFLPSISSPAKRTKLAELGAKVTIAGDVYADALAACLARQAETGALLTHAYDQMEVVAGAATLGAEIQAQVGTPDSVLVSVGGGGLIAGLATWFDGRSRVVALEPELAPTLHAARAAGQPVDVAVSGIAADALGAKRIGDIAWRITQTQIKDSLLLSDDAIRAAQTELWRQWRLAVEPAAALPLAALRTGAYVPAKTEKVCLIICGGNVDLTNIAA